MIFRQDTYATVVSYLLVLLLMACSDPSLAVESPTPVAPSERAPVLTLVLWHAWPSPEQQTLAMLIDRYNRAHPNIQIIPQAWPIATFISEVRAAALARSGPHLILLKSHTLGGLAQDGLLLPLDTLIDQTEQRRLVPTTILSAQIPGDTENGQLYGLPIAFDTLVLYYNRANVRVPPADTETLLNTARGLTDASTRPPVWGMAYTLSLDRTIGYLYAFGGRVFDDEGNLVLGNEGREGTERWLTWLLELRQDPQILAVNDSITIDNALKAREALMTIDWAHALPKYRMLWGENLGVAVLPTLSETNRPAQPYLQSDVISLNARVTDSNEQRAALDFMRYMLQEEAQQALLAVDKQPALLSLRLNRDILDHEVARVFRHQARNAQGIPNNPMAHEVVREELERMQLKVLRGLESPADAVTIADSLLRQRLGLPPSAEAP